MKSFQHVLWRGALALSLVAVGVASGIGLPAPVQQAAAPGDCPDARRSLIADREGTERRRETVIVLRRALTPAG